MSMAILSGLMPSIALAQLPPPLIAQSRASLTGSVTYRPRIALPPNAVVEVKLQEVSRLDAPAVTVAEQRIETKGRQVPIPFELNYDASRINPSYTYVVQARILVDNQLRWINTTAYQVLTRGNPANNLEIVVDPARVSESVPSTATPISPQRSTRYDCEAQVRSYKSARSVNLAEAQRLRLQRDGSTFVYRCVPAATLPNDRYNCKSQIAAYPDRNAVDLPEAEELLRQIEGDAFVYQCSSS
jgi:uncharacterized lipoprotein YbaY